MHLARIVGAARPRELGSRLQRVGDEATTQLGPFGLGLDRGEHERMRRRPGCTGGGGDALF